MSEKLFSDKPADVLAMADELIEHLKGELAKFDASKAPHYDRLRAYVSQARDDGDSERYEDFSREAGRYLARWQDARRPFIQEIMRLALARDLVDPAKMTPQWVRATFVGVGQSGAVSGAENAPQKPTP